jgi:hypothetical protein
MSAAIGRALRLAASGLLLTPIVHLLPDRFLVEDLGDERR